MKIAVFCDLLPTLLNFRGHLVRSMAEISNQVVVVAPPADKDSVDQLKNLNADFYPMEMDRTGLNPVRDLVYYKSLKKFLGESQPDHSFAYQAKAAVYSSIAARSLPNLKTNVLFPGLGYLFANGGSVKDKALRKVARQLYRFAFKDVDNFFFQNPDDLATLQRYRIIPTNAKTILVYGSGVPLDWYEFSPPVTQPVRFLFMGRLLWEKGLGEFFAAAKSVSQKWGNEVEFQIIGPLDSNPTAISQKELYHQCRICNVAYEGVTKDVRPFLRSASVFVLPSYYMEGTPRSILEAMSMGRPIITTDSRGCREPVNHQENGFLVAPRDANELASAMNKFIVDRGLIEIMGKVSRRLAEEKFDVFKVNAAMLSGMGLIKD